MARHFYPPSEIYRKDVTPPIDIEACPHCGGKLRIIACIEDPPLIRKILEYVQQRGDAGFSQARAPPVCDGARLRLN